MVCKKCGYSNEEDSNFCKNCGANLKERSKAENSEIKPIPQTPPGQSDATLAMIFGIISIVMCSVGIGAGITALVIANKAKRQGCNNGATQAGTICGIIGIVLGTIVLLFYVGSFLLGILSGISSSGTGL